MVNERKLNDIQINTPCGSTSNKQTLIDGQSVRVFSCLFLACFWRDGIKRFFINRKPLGAEVK